MCTMSTVTRLSPSSFRCVVRLVKRCAEVERGRRRLEEATAAREATGERTRRPRCVCCLRVILVQVARIADQSVVSDTTSLHAYSIAKSNPARAHYAQAKAKSSSHDSSADEEVGPSRGQYVRACTAMCRASVPRMHRPCRRCLFRTTTRKRVPKLGLRTCVRPYFVCHQWTRAVICYVR